MAMTSVIVAHRTGRQNTWKYEFAATAKAHSPTFQKVRPRDVKKR